MFNIDTKDIKKLTDNLKKISRSAYPLAVRGTLNRLAFETSNIAKKEILPKLFTLRNKYIQGTVGYQRCQNTFNIAAMESFAGQFAISKGKPTGQLAKQETGSPIVAKGKYTFAATPSARGGSYKKTVRKANLLASLKAQKLSDLVANPTTNPNKQAAQAQAFAVRNKKTVNVLLTNSKGHKGIYKISKKSVNLLYDLRNKKTSIKRTQWLKISSDKILSKVENIYMDEAAKRFEKVMSQGLSHS